MAGEESGDLEGNRIRVAVRCRPFSAKELAEDAAGIPVIKCSDVAVTVPSVGDRPEKNFGFDHVFNSQDGQEIIFQAIGEKLLENALSAYNGCIFAYGQTGSGKSHSVVGDLSSEPEKGILPRACVRLFELLASRREDDARFEATVLASYLEIYNEKLYDLLSGGAREKDGELQVRLHPQLGPIVVNLTECPMQSFGKALELFDFGTKRRAVGATQMNATSSRSHAVFTVQIRMRMPVAGGCVESQSKVHFVDLAGSEKQKKSGATGVRLKEGIGINLSLTTLGRVISELTKPGNKSVPAFRESKLTLLLKDALMGNSRTELLACISPSRSNLEETVSTLEFASRCKLVKTSAMKNEQSRQDVIAKLTEEKEQIEAQLQREKAQSEELCRQLREELEKREEKQKDAEKVASEKKTIEERLKYLENQLEDQRGDSEQVKQLSDERERLLQEREDILAAKEREKELNQQNEVQREELARTQALLKEKEGLLEAVGAAEAQSREEEELLKGRLEEERRAQEAREEELREQLEALKGVQESLALDQAQINTKREEQHHLREAELSKLGMHLMGVDPERMGDAPKLMNLHPDPALKGCLVYYLPLGETKIGTCAESCRVRLTGRDIGEEVCCILNEDNERLEVKRFPGALVRLNGVVVAEGTSLLLHDGDRLAVGRAYIFQVQIPRLAAAAEAAGDGARSRAESDFERAMSELLAYAEVDDPAWESMLQRAMLLVKSEFGAEAAATLAGQARRASEAIAVANFWVREMPKGWTDGVAKFELAIMFDARGLPEVCVIARREESTSGSPSAEPGDPGGSGLRGRSQSAGIWEAEHFLNERLPAMEEALMQGGRPCGSELPGLEHWETRVWGEVSVEDYRILATHSAEHRRSAEDELHQAHWQARNRRRRSDRSGSGAKVPSSPEKQEKQGHGRSDGTPSHSPDSEGFHEKIARSFKDYWRVTRDAGSAVAQRVRRENAEPGAAAGGERPGEGPAGGQAASSRAGALSSARSALLGRSSSSGRLEKASGALTQGLLAASSQAQESPFFRGQQAALLVGWPGRVESSSRRASTGSRETGVPSASGDVPQPTSPATI